MSWYIALSDLCISTSQAWWLSMCWPPWQALSSMLTMLIKGVIPWNKVIYPTQTRWVITNTKSQCMLCTKSISCMLIFWPQEDGLSSAELVFTSLTCHILLSGIVLWMCPVNERRRYNVTSSLIGCVHSQNDPCFMHTRTINIITNIPLDGFIQSLKKMTGLILKFTVHTSYFLIIQLVPYFVMDVLNYPGVAGIFLAVLFSGALRYVLLYVF